MVSEAQPLPHYEAAEHPDCWRCAAQQGVSYFLHLRGLIAQDYADFLDCAQQKGLTPAEMERQAIRDTIACALPRILLGVTLRDRRQIVYLVYGNSATISPEDLQATVTPVSQEDLVLDISPRPGRLPVYIERLMMPTIPGALCNYPLFTDEWLLTIGKLNATLFPPFDDTGQILSF